jgi:uncharacterized protein YceH (UPF0502 family)
MQSNLSPEEIRVLGALIEKQLTTPEYYPLTLNALMKACNQLTNREPVVNYDEDTVLRAINRLKSNMLAYVITGADSRVPKYEQAISRTLNLAEQETAVLCVLMLRGPQTIGEIKERSSRLYAFSDLGEVEATLDELINRNPQSLVMKLARKPGTKEARYAQLLGDAPANETPPPTEKSEALPIVAAEDIRVAKLEQQLAEVRAELEALKAEFAQFKKQFE